MATRIAMSVRGIAAATFDLSRGRQAALSVAQPALGALLALGVLPSTRVVVLGLVAASAGYLAVFSLNDVLDRGVDAEALKAGKAESQGYDIDTAFERHPLARGDLSLFASVVWVGVLGVLAAVCAYILSPACLAVFVLAVMLEIAYCALRAVTWTKTFISGLMVAVGGLAGWIAVAPLSAGAVPFFAFLALWEIGGRNLPNDLADLAADSRVGIRTVATVFGSTVSAGATAVVALMTFVPLVLLGDSLLLMTALFVLGVWALAIPAVSLIGAPTSEQAGSYFNRASLLPALVFVPVLLSALMR